MSPLCTSVATPRACFLLPSGESSHVSRPSCVAKLHSVCPRCVGAVWREKTQMLASKTIEEVRRLVELDSRPFTLNSHYLDHVRAKILAHLKDKRSPQSSDEATAMPAIATTTTNTAAGGAMKDALAQLAALGFSGLTEADLKKLRPVDPYETELEVMAEMRAYFQIAYKVIKHVPKR